MSHETAKLFDRLLIAYIYNASYHIIYVYDIM